MNKLTIIAIVAVVVGAFAAPKAEAQHYHSRVVGTCPVCKTAVYAYYRPVSYGGIIQYQWVPVYHTTCMARQRSVVRYQTTVPYRPSRIVYPSSGYSGYSGHHHHHRHSCSTGYAGFTTPGFSVIIRR